MNGDNATILAIEGGGTKTIALIADARGRILHRHKFGPLNLKLSTDRQILSVLRRSSLRSPSVVTMFLAGCLTENDRNRMRRLIARVFPKVRAIVGNDLESGLAAAGTDILVISGTGSCVFGRNGRRTAKVGGWGHLLGDTGSGYWMAHQTLRAGIEDYDRTGKTNRALQKALRALCLNSPEQLVNWIHAATKAEVAGLTGELFGMEPRVIEDAANAFATECATAARKLRLPVPTVALAGGVFGNHPQFCRLTAKKICERLPDAKVQRPKFESEYGAVVLAVAPLTPTLSPGGERGTIRMKAIQMTEQRNPRTMDLDKRSIPELIDTMLDEDRRIVPALRANKPAIGRAIRAIVASFKKGGRLFYVGAGTSGRIGVLDASECPPTFSAPTDMVQGIIAGGANALHSPVEAGEDDGGAGAEAVRCRGVNRKDVVVGIAASGTTPYVIGALDEAKRQGARTFLLSFSPPKTKRHAPLTFKTGPEVVTGSTRLKAGTATKLVLNMLTTISMIRLGKVVGNLMVDVQPTNEKLRARACRIVSALQGCGEAEARERLVRARWNVKKALR